MENKKEFYSFEGARRNPELKEYLDDLVETLNSSSSISLCEENVLAYVLKMILQLVDKGRVYPTTSGTILKHIGYIMDGEKSYLDDGHVLDETVSEDAARIKKSKTGYVRELGENPINRHIVGDGFYMINPPGDTAVYRFGYKGSPLSEAQCKELEKGNTVKIDGTELSLRKSSNTGKWYIYDSERTKAYLKSKRQAS